MKLAKAGFGRKKFWTSFVVIGMGPFTYYVIALVGGVGRQNVWLFPVIKLCLQRERGGVKKGLIIVTILLSTGIGWMARLAEISVGIGLGLHLPSQQLMVAETALPHQRYVYFTAH